MPDDLLPPVEPPSASFLVQLFVVPALIVAGIALLWLLVNSVVLGRTTDPRDLIRGLERSGVTRWQTALELANVLRDPRHDAVRKDHELAQMLGQVLERSIQDGDIGQKAVTMRYFVAGAIGVFQVDDGMPALLLAAQTQRDAEELDTRLAAIARWHSSPRRCRNRTEPGQPNKRNWPMCSTRSRVTTRIASDRTRRLPWALLKCPLALDQLQRLVDDPYPDARFNAAVALARRGDAAAIETLAEMLDPDETAGLDLEKADDGQAAKTNRSGHQRFESGHPLGPKKQGCRFGPPHRTVAANRRCRRRPLQAALLQPAAINEAKAALDVIR